MLKTSPKNQQKLLKLVDFLQDNTDLAVMLDGYGYSDKKTDDNPAGDFALIERYLVGELDAHDSFDELLDLIK